VRCTVGILALKLAVGSGGKATTQGYKGVSKKFLDDSKTRDMSRREIKRRVHPVSGFGHLAQMVVFGLIGYGLVKAAVNYNPRSAIGLDRALNTLLHNSYGPFLLVAAGLIGFALYSIADARYPKI